MYFQLLLFFTMHNVVCKITTYLLWNNKFQIQNVYLHYIELSNVSNMFLSSPISKSKFMYCVFFSLYNKNCLTVTQVLFERRRTLTWLVDGRCPVIPLVNLCHVKGNIYERMFSYVSFFEVVKRQYLKPKVVDLPPYQP